MMRRRVVWTLVALTTALFWVGAGASAGGSIESGMWERLRLCGGADAPLLEARTAASGSVALSWSGGSAGATRWEYRQQQEGGGWGAWAAIAGSDASTAEHTVAGLTEDVRYHFQLRAITANGASLASATASAVAGLTPSTYLSFRYNKYDATSGATARGAYAFLTNSTDLSSGISDYSDAPTAAALLVNARGASGRAYAERLDTLAVGDMLTWYIAPSCWFAYRVTALLNSPPTPARKLFAIELTAQGSTCVGPIDTDRWTSVFRGPLPSEPRTGRDGIRIFPDNYPVEGGHTYRLNHISPGWIVVDVPAGMRLIHVRVFEAPDGIWWSFLKDEASGAVLTLSFGTGRELGRWFPPEQGSDGETRDVGALFDAIAASARVQPE